MVKKESPPASSAIDRLVAEALGRDGVFTTEDACRWGASPAGLTRAISKGRIARLLPRVYVVAGTPITWWTRARAATAWSNGALSHLSAGYAHRLIEQPPAEIEIVTAEARKVPGGIRLRCHASPLMAPPHVVTVRGVPVTAPARTLLDIAPLVPQDILEAGLEDALRRGLLNMPRLEWHLRTEGGKGRRGTAALRRLLEARGPQLAAAESVLETRVARWFRSTRLPVPVRQYRVLAEARFIARLDFAYPDAKVAVEAISYRWHSGRRAWLRDAERQRDLRDLGWRIVEVTDEDVRQRGAELEAEIAALLGITLF